MRARNVPKPAGGCASRSTSSLSVVIWSRASRSVCARRSFWLETAARDRWASASRGLQAAGLTGHVVEAAAQVGDLGLQVAHLSGKLLACRFGHVRTSSSVATLPTHSMGRK